MNTADVIRQLAATLPNYTTLFSSTLPLSSVSASGGVVTVVTSSPHNLTTGFEVTVTGGLTRLTAAIAWSGGVATVTTTPTHDQTEGYNETVTVGGATEPQFNGTHPLLTTPDRNTLTLSIPSAPAVATGTPYINQSLRGRVNGRHTVTVVDPTTFTYVNSTCPDGIIDNATIHDEIRVSGAAIIERALSAMTEQNINELWGFVVLEDVVSSRDRTVKSDANFNITDGSVFRIRELESFSLYAVIPSADSITGRTPRDLASDLTPAIYKSLLGVLLPTGLTCERTAVITPESNGFFAYDGAYYVHRWMFGTHRDITVDDIAPDEDNVAFESINIKTLNSFDEPLTDDTIVT